MQLKITIKDGRHSGTVKIGLDGAEGLVDGLLRRLVGLGDEVRKAVFSEEGGDS